MTKAPGRCRSARYQLGKREWIDRHRDFRYLSVETTELDVRHYFRGCASG